MRKLLIVTLLFGLFIPSVIFAHPGRTDSYGCHTCRTNCSKWGLSTGEYHCHRAKVPPQPKEPIKSHFSENGGSTTPAPEYKQPIIPTSKTINTLEVKKVEALPITEKLDSKIITEKKSDEAWIIRLLKFLFG